MAGTDEHPRWYKGPVVERSTGKMGRKMEAEARLRIWSAPQDLTWLQGTRKEMSQHETEKAPR